jgi:hypothetical protein
MDRRLRCERGLTLRIPRAGRRSSSSFSVLLVVAAGCFNTPEHLRHGQTLGKGEFELGLTWSAPISVPATATLENGELVTSQWGRKVTATEPGAYMMSVFPRVAARVGLTSKAELGFSMGPVDFEALGRHGLIDSDGFDLAAQGAIIMDPFATASAIPGTFRAGLDASSGDDLQLIYNAYAELGKEAFASDLTVPEDDPLREGPLAPGFLVRRPQLRLVGAVGAGVPIGRTRLNLGVTPYWIPWSGEISGDCAGCTQDPVDFGHDWGIGLVLSLQIRPTR